MIVGMGIDIQEIKSVEEKISPRFLQKIFTDQEQAYYTADKIHSIAGGFAAKEAVSKALGTGFVGFSWRDIAILHDQTGAPLAVLQGGAEKRLKALGGGRVHVSIAHSKDYAVAQAIIEKEPLL